MKQQALAQREQDRIKNLSDDRTRYFGLGNGYENQRKYLQMANEKQSFRHQQYLDRVDSPKKQLEAQQQSQEFNLDHRRSHSLEQHLFNRRET